MKKPSTILVPTDLSGFSLEALDYAQEIAGMFNAEILVVLTKTSAGDYLRSKRTFESLGHDGWEPREQTATEVTAPATFDQN